MFWVGTGDCDSSYFWGYNDWHEEEAREGGVDVMIVTWRLERAELV